MKALQVLVLILATFVLSDATATTFSATDGQGNMVRLFEQKCDGPEWLNLKRAYFRFQGKDYDACWLAIGNTVVIFDSAGDVTPLPKNVFKPDVEA